MTSKACSKCKIVQSLDEFHKGAGRYGRRSDCKTCVKIYSKKRYDADPEKYRNISQEYKANNKDSVAEYNRSWRNDNPNYDQAWRQANPEKVKQYEAIHRIRFQDERNAYSQEWRAANPDYAKQWAKDNRDKMCAYRNKRRALINQSVENFTAEELIELYELYDYTCLRCRLREGEINAKGKLVQMTPDHIIPVSRGGSNGIDNIQPLCGPCNSSKLAKTIDYRSAYDA